MILCAKGKAKVYATISCIQELAVWYPRRQYRWLTYHPSLICFLH